MSNSETRPPRAPARGIGRAVASFLTVVLSILGGSWAIVGAVVNPWIGGGWRTIGLLAIALTIVPLVVFIGVRGLRLYAGRWLRLFVFRPFWYGQLLLLGAALAAMLGAVAGLPFGVAGGVARIFVSVAVIGFVIMFVAGYLGSRRMMRRTLEVHYPDLPGGLEGLRIVQVSDLHVGPHSRRAEQRNVTEAVQSARPDLVVVTGDLVDDFPHDVARFGELLPGFAAPLGIFAIPGNHDIYAGWADVLREMAALPLTLLVNESRTIERNGAHLTVAGTGDPAAGPGGDSARGAVNIARTLASIPPNTFVIALAHNPALWPPLAQAGVHLTLSGHTHWGQFAIPSRNWSLASVFLELAMGWHVRGGSVLWINPGTSYWGIPFRIGAYAEVSVLVLRRGPLRVTELGYERIG